MVAAAAVLVVVVVVVVAVVCDCGCVFVRALVFFLYGGNVIISGPSPLRPRVVRTTTSKGTRKQMPIWRVRVWCAAVALTTPGRKGDSPELVVVVAVVVVVASALLLL